LSAEQIAERNLLEWKLFSELTPYAMQTLNERHVLYAALFIQQHMNTIRMDLCDIDFQALSIQYMAYCVTSAEYRAQQMAAATPAADASGSKKRASEASAEDSSDAKRLVKVLTAAINTALDSRSYFASLQDQAFGSTQRVDQTLVLQLTSYASTVHV
jgi:hypothetical protein